MISPDIRVLLVDNYDSFTYNISHIVRNYPGTNLQIVHAGDLRPEEPESFDKIIFSPGPDYPKPGNIMERILSSYAGKKPVLGICLGFQAICLFFGGRLKQLAEPVHGKTMVIGKTGSYSRVLSGIPESFKAGLYHSWIVDPDYLPDCLTVTSETKDGRIMSIRHKQYDIEAVQFHPESVMTPLGARMIDSWLA
ncbi:MAG: aminodeoxychorismate/anthranilate synthase component II [Bacteroidota bacterium]